MEQEEDLREGEEPRPVRMLLGGRYDSEVDFFLNESFRSTREFIFDPFNVEGKYISPKYLKMVIVTEKRAYQW